MIKTKYKYYNFIDASKVSHSKIECRITAVLQYILFNSMEYSYYCLWVFHEGVAKIKKTVIYENHADSRESFL